MSKPSNKKRPEGPVGSANTVAPDTLSFEQNLESLETILAQLEKGELPLENQLELFESGVSLSRHCLQRLESVEKRVEQLVANAQSGGESRLETRTFVGGSEP